MLGLVSNAPGEIGSAFSALSLESLFAKNTHKLVLGSILSVAMASRIQVRIPVKVNAFGRSCDGAWSSSCRHRSHQPVAEQRWCRSSFPPRVCIATDLSYFCCCFSLFCSKLDFQRREPRSIFPPAGKKQNMSSLCSFSFSRLNQVGTEGCGTWDNTTEMVSVNLQDEAGLDNTGTDMLLAG